MQRVIPWGAELDVETSGWQMPESLLWVRIPYSPRCRFDTGPPLHLNISWEFGKGDIMKNMSGWWLWIGIAIIMGFLILILTTTDIDRTAVLNFFNQTVSESTLGDITLIGVMLVFGNHCMRD